MTAVERRLLWWSTGGVAVLALAGWVIVFSPRWLGMLLVLVFLAIVRWCVVGWLYEGKPRLRRVEWRSPGSKWGPAEIRRLAELERNGGRE